jgi:hypothetical protein
MSTRPAGSPSGPIPATASHPARASHPAAAPAGLPRTRAPAASYAASSTPAASPAPRSDRHLAPCLDQARGTLGHERDPRSPAAASFGTTIFMTAPRVLWVLDRPTGRNGVRMDQCCTKCPNGGQHKDRCSAALSGYGGLSTHVPTGLVGQIRLQGAERASGACSSVLPVGNENVCVTCWAPPRFEAQTSWRALPIEHGEPVELRADS